MAVLPALLLNISAAACSCADPPRPRTSTPYTSPPLLVKIRSIARRYPLEECARFVTSDPTRTVRIFFFVIHRLRAPPWAHSFASAPPPPVLPYHLLLISCRGFCLTLPVGVCAPPPFLPTLSHSVHANRCLGCRCLSKLHARLLCFALFHLLPCLPPQYFLALSLSPSLFPNAHRKLRPVSRGSRLCPSFLSVPIHIECISNEFLR